jgi:hypothetical protein
MIYLSSRSGGPDLSSVLIAFIIYRFFLASRCSKAVSCLSVASVNWSNEVNSRQSNIFWRSTDNPTRERTRMERLRRGT